MFKLTNSSPSLLTAVATLLSVALFTGDLLANASDTTRARVKRESTNYGPVWSQNRIAVNVDYRLPLTEMAAFLALNYGEDQTIFQPILADLKSIQKEAGQLKKTLSIRGQNFPDEADAQTTRLREKAYNSFSHHAGPASLPALKNFLEDNVNGSTFGMRTGNVNFRH